MHVAIVKFKEKVIKPRPIIPRGFDSHSSRRGVCAIILSALAALALPDVATAASVGVYSAAKGLYYLTTTTEGTATPAPVRIEGARKTWLPVLGAGSFKFGLYDKKTGTFHLRMEENSGPITKSVKFEGFQKNWLPVAGDWDGDQAYGVGLYDPKSGTFYLKNQLTDGPADTTVRLDNTQKSWKPLVGDWDGDGIASVGAYDPGTGQFHLRNANTDGSADLALQIQGLKKSLRPVTADWDNDGIWSPGLYNPAARAFYWRNALNSGPQEGSVTLAGVKGSVQPITRSVAIAAPTPAVTEVGTPIGTAATATIGPAGGTLSAADNTLVLSIPPGALAANTMISIQPITNHAHGGKGKAYRLLPDGQTFQQPVKLTFGYTDQDLLGTAAGVLGAAFQTAEGYWRWLDAPVVDTAAKTVTVATPHFTDFSLVEGLNLRPGEATVLVGESIKLEVKLCYPYFGPGPKGPDAVGLGYDCDGEESILAPLVRVTEWAVNGVAGGGGARGTISVSGESPHIATYTAPARKPNPDTVAVSVLIKSEIGATLLVSHITIVDEDKFYKGSVDFDNGPEISGKADITWTLFEDLSDVRRYMPTGNIVVDFKFDNCDPLTATIPVNSGTVANPAGTLVVFPEKNTAFPMQYWFSFNGDWNTTVILTCYHDQAHKNPYPRTYIGGWIGVPVVGCGDGGPGGNPTPGIPYTDKRILMGAQFCSDPLLNAVWSFKSVLAPQ